MRARCVVLLLLLLLLLCLFNTRTRACVRFCGSRRFVCTGTRLAPPGARARSKKAERLRTELTPIRSQREGWFLSGLDHCFIYAWKLQLCDGYTSLHFGESKRGGVSKSGDEGFNLGPSISIQFQCRPPFSVLPAPFRLSTVVVRWSCKPKVPGSNPGGGFLHVLHGGEGTGRCAGARERGWMGGGGLFSHLLLLFFFFYLSLHPPPRFQFLDRAATIKRERGRGRAARRCVGVEVVFDWQG